MNNVDVQLAYDFICPWCWVGHRHLKSALESEKSQVVATLSYVPYELNPNLPWSGVDRKGYRTAKFGSWARSQAMDADVVVAGKKVGLEFNYERVAITPNTRLAHRLMVYARQSAGDEAKADVLFESIFESYFSRGENIGRLDVLVSLAASAGFDAEQTRKFLRSDRGEAEVAAKELQAQMEGVHAVPTIRIGAQQVRGAQPPSILVEVLRTASARQPQIAGELPA